MTRNQLLYSICPTERKNKCKDYQCSDCTILLTKWLDEYDKNNIDTIREIHDKNIIEMYCKGIDDFVEKVELKYLGVNPDELYEKYYPREICEQIKEIAKQLKAGVKYEV